MTAPTPDNGWIDNKLMQHLANELEVNPLVKIHAVDTVLGAQEVAKALLLIVAAHCAEPVRPALEAQQPDTSPGDEIEAILLEVQKNTDAWWNTPQPEYKGKHPATIRAEAKDRLNRLMLTRERERLEKLKPKLIAYAHSPVGWAKYKKLDNGDYLMDGKKTDKLAEDIVNYSFDIAIAAIDAQLEEN